MNFDIENTSTRVNKRETKNKLVIDALIEIQMLKFKDFINKFKSNQIQMQKRFDVEIT
jgi:hypothetical protein